MMRSQGWENRLNKLIQERMNTPFKWGGHDCCLFACDVVKALTGHDPGDRFRGKYQTKAEAFKLLKEFAGGGILPTAEMITKEMGMLEIKPTFGQRGDVCYLENETGFTLGVFSMDGRIVAPGEKGLVFLPITAGLKAWRVG